MVGSVSRATQLGCGGDTGERAAAGRHPRAEASAVGSSFGTTSPPARRRSRDHPRHPGKLDSAGFPTAVNAGVSGETSAGALRRIDWVLREPAAVLVIETGANDGLRGLDTDTLRANIQAIIDRATRQSPPPRIILVGMRALPNYGFGYARRFERVYPDLAKANDVPLVPFLLDGVAGTEGMNQVDMIHPTPDRVTETVWEVLEVEGGGRRRV
jgi:hypothetical protein